MILFSWGLSGSVVGNVLTAVSLLTLACYLWERVRLWLAARNVGPFFDDY